MRLGPGAISPGRQKLTAFVTRSSPNFGVRRGGATPSLIVLHYTAMGTDDEACARLCDPASEVSAHYLVGRAGSIVHLVEERARAWHAGKGAWGRVTDVNSHSIGIEMSNDGVEPFSDLQMSALEKLLRDIRIRWSIPLQNVIAHSDLAPDRKCDPGRRFDWRRLALSGNAVWPDGEGDPKADFRQAARQFGYPDAAPDLLLEAFRQRFRPWAFGEISDADRSCMDALARRYPVDARMARS